MIRQFIRNKTVIAMISISTGIYLMIARKNATYTLIRMVGYALFVAAASYVVLYFVRGDHDQMKLQYAGGAAVLGLGVQLLAPAILHLLPVLLGLAIIVAGVSNLLGARSQNLPKSAWAGPILTIVLGAVILFHPGSIISTVVFLAGVALVLNGLSELDLIRRVW